MLINTAWIPIDTDWPPWLMAPGPEFPVRTDRDSLNLTSELTEIANGITDHSWIFQLIVTAFQLWTESDTTRIRNVYF